MPQAHRDYRKLTTRALLAVFFGILAAAIAPDLGLGLRLYWALAGTVTAAIGLWALAGLPVHGAYQPLMATAGILAFIYAVDLVAVIAAPSSPIVEASAKYARGFGAVSFFLTTAGLEILSRRLKWVRIARGWLFTETAVALIYAVPAVMSWFWPLYAPYIEKTPFLARAFFYISGLEFHGLRVPGIMGGSRWLVLMLLVFVAPVAMILVNLLRTYVKAATPAPPPDETPPIPWSRR